MTGTWALFRQLGGYGLCFSADSRLVALLDASKVVRLVEVETGRVIARLESPDMSDVGYAAFSPDGSKLALTIRNNQPSMSGTWVAFAADWLRCDSTGMRQPIKSRSLLSPHCRRIKSISAR